eukprot:TRINITY_DN14114_c0_g1_i1.p2 TRINITY_DN14114_c0_g1~~TRINITY_DN14114_c0_g1_i1.p2  ORF type:complete len:73 (+),score=7.19 TRINITY_DN14114_c0_g1_i1:237-455(+)
MGTCHTTDTTETAMEWNLNTFQTAFFYKYSEQHIAIYTVSYIVIFDIINCTGFCKSYNKDSSEKKFCITNFA